MFKYRIINTPACALCRSQTETFEHFFVTCAVVQGVKNHEVSWFLNKSDFDTEDLLHPKFYGETGGMRNAVILSEFIFVLWVIRRQVIFDRKIFDLVEATAFFDFRLKWRLKADAKRLSKDKFIKIWGRRRLFFSVGYKVNVLLCRVFLCSYSPRRGAELTGRLLAPAGAREAPAAGGGRERMCDSCRYFKCCFD
jgi:hypothetical protein